MICYSTVETPHHRLSCILCKPLILLCWLEVLHGSSDEKEDDQVVEMHTYDFGMKSNTCCVVSNCRMP